MCVEKLVQVGQHLRDTLPVLLGGTFEGLFHAGKTLVEQFAAEQVLDLLVVRPGLRRTPVVVGEFFDGLRGRRREAPDLHLGEPGVVVEVTGELFAFLENGPVEQLADLGEGAVEVASLEEFLPTPVHLLAQLVQATHVLRTAPQELAQRTLRRHPGHHIVTDLAERLPEIDRGCQRIGTAGVALIA